LLFCILLAAAAGCKKKGKRKDLQDDGDSLNLMLFDWISCFWAIIKSTGDDCGCCIVSMVGNCQLVENAHCIVLDSKFCAILIGEP